MSDQIYNEVNSDLDPFKKILGKIPALRATWSGRSGVMQINYCAVRLRLALKSNGSASPPFNVSSLAAVISPGSMIWMIPSSSCALLQIEFRRATRGYSGLFDAVMINEKNLPNCMLSMRNCWIFLMKSGEPSTISRHRWAPTGLPAAIRNLNTVAQNCIETFNWRGEVFLGNPAG